MKGHENYYIGKKIKATKFLKAFEMFIKGEIDYKIAALMLDLSVPTVQKRFEEYAETGELRDDIFY